MNLLCGSVARSDSARRWSRRFISSSEGIPFDLGREYRNKLAIAGMCDIRVWYRLTSLLLS